MDKNIVQFGLSRLYIATIRTMPDNATPTYDDPIPWAGAVSLSMDADTDETTFYADNRKYFGTFTDNGYSGEIETAKVKPEIAEAVLGWRIDDLGGIVEIANAQTKNFALMGQLEGDKFPGRFVIYNCTAGKPSTDVSTTEETAEPQTQTLPYTASNIYIGDLLVTRYTLWDDPEDAEIHAAYTKWFDQVTLPTMAGGEDE